MWASCRDQYGYPLVLTQQIIGRFGLAEWLWERKMYDLWMFSVSNFVCLSQHFEMSLY